jgi:hypothetical protein
MLSGASAMFGPVAFHGNPFLQAFAVPVNYAKRTQATADMSREPQFAADLAGCSVEPFLQNRHLPDQCRRQQFFEVRQQWQHRATPPF